MMELEHDEAAEFLGAYALDAVEADERDAIERHLAVCPRCAAEVAEHREVAATLAYSGAPAPEGVWSKIVGSLEEQPPELDLPGFASNREKRPTDELADRRARRSARPFLMSAAAAAAVVVALVAGVVIGSSEDGANDAEFAAESIADVARRALNDPDSAKVTLSSPDDEEVTATAAVVSDGSGYLLGTSLPALDPSETYQLWGIREGVVVSLGVLGHSPDVVAFHLDPSTEALAITVEEAGGVPVSGNPALLVGNVT